ncbi:hypothetical protein K469DRAFT_794354 [Zopfia rhizophila CBS 207.26]|uniref:DUF6697 domain-containing protein n=1 Tax=Zopfia rhizophila CBS 207.26 TaxID=1314779 RepID=A0A6A6DQZ6_9PEZI|nr:hypothetical protein K469DRAFT_794354 [Zopfia rhizophila CBS 207.26]
MSNRDPYPFRQSDFTYSASFNGAQYSNATAFHPHLNVRVPDALPQLDPAAGQFQPSFTYPHQDQHHDLTHGHHNGNQQVSIQVRLEHVVASVQQLEREQKALRLDVERLKETRDSLHSEVDSLKKGGWKVEIGPHRQTSTQELRQKLEDLEASMNGSNISSTIKDGKINRTVAMNGDKAQGYPSDTLTVAPVHAPQPPARAPAPSSIATTVKANTPLPSIEDPYHTQSGKAWKPLTVRNFPPLPMDTLSMIPAATSMQTFSYDFLKNAFGGISWSPGLNYIPPAPGPCILRNRTYYTLDAKNEPYLPEVPGTHGAKLTAFFNSNLEEVDGEEAEASYEDVPMFVCSTGYAVADKKRYVYFGHYSQTRWSDKLDYDRIAEDVPHDVKMYWAEELSATGRPEWVTQALMKHFWPKPEYVGRLFGSDVADGSVVGDEDKDYQKVMADVKTYVEELKVWEKDARIKVGLIKREFILEAFEMADADDPPALRLWWEYLRCVGWDRAFYSMLVELQARNPNYF